MAKTLRAYADGGSSPSILANCRPQPTRFAACLRLSSQVMLRRSYHCPECNCPWRHRKIFLHTWRRPIVCPGCAGRFNFERRQWRRLSVPMLTAVVALLFSQIVGRHFLERDTFFVLFGIAFAVFIVTTVWWCWAVATKLRFTRATEK